MMRFRDVVRAGGGLRGRYRAVSVQDQFKSYISEVLINSFNFIPNTDIFGD